MEKLIRDIKELNPFLQYNITKMLKNRLKTINKK